jgi:hypothetical protein
MNLTQGGGPRQFRELTAKKFEQESSQIQLRKGYGGVDV